MLGVVLFALGIALSIAAHEFGHLLTAKAFGMKARRYFIGFGRSIWSFRKGETEYGLKAIPLGGFVDIAGMTTLDDQVTEAERPRAFYSKPVWQRVVVMSAGSVAHFVIGVVVLFLTAVSFGLPDLSPNPLPAVGQISDCVSDQDPVTGHAEPCQEGSRPAPAGEAGLEPGDVLLSIGGTPIRAGEDAPDAWGEQAIERIRAASGPTEFVVERDGEPLAVTVDVATVERLPLGVEPGPDSVTEPTGVVGMARGVNSIGYSPAGAVPATFEFTGQMFQNTWEGIKRLPEKVPALFRAIMGEQDPERPISVVGASVIGGDAAELGLWQVFLLLLAGVNIFIGVMNLLPLLPLDGGHIAVNVYQKVRDMIRKMRGLPVGGPVDYTKLLPLTYLVVIIGGAFMLLAITADVVNPIRLQ